MTKNIHMLITDAATAIVDAICEARGTERCTLPHCSCSATADKIVAPLLKHIRDESQE